MRWIFLLLFIMVACTACGKDFTNQHGLNRHRTGCNLARNRAAQLLHHRHQLQKSVTRDEFEAGQSKTHTESMDVSPEVRC